MSPATDSGQAPAATSQARPTRLDPLEEKEVDDILDFVINNANRWKIYYLWRPQLKDPSDDMVLELAVTANCNYIITYNVSDFKGIENFGIATIIPKGFLKLVGEI